MFLACSFFALLDLSYKVGARWVHVGAPVVDPGMSTMATGKVTKRAVDALAGNGTKQFLWDDELRGFGLQVTPSGAKSYVYQYRLGGREAAKRRYTIGRHGSPWTPASAREECERLALMVGQGVDPADADRERRRQAVDLAFSGYVETFVEGYLKLHWKDWAKSAALLRREPVDVLGRKPLPTITRADMVLVFDRLRDRPATARLAYAILRKLFRWAEGRGEIGRGLSPLGADFPAPGAVKSRDRVLSDWEISAVWRAAQAMAYPFGPLFQILVATGQRREEGSGLHWAELDRCARLWSLPAERAKNGHGNILHLNDLAVAALDSVAARTMGTDSDGNQIWPAIGFVFTTTGDTPVSGHSKAKIALDKAVAKVLTDDEKSGAPARTVAPWRVHDLRRTVTTGLQRLGIRFEVTEAVLNHRERARGGIAGVYQRHDWKEEKRAALEAWCAHITAILSPPDRSNVTPMARLVA